MVNYQSDRDPGHPLVYEITDEGGQAVEKQADVSTGADVSRLFEQAVASFAMIDLPVINAGIEKQTPFLDLSKADLNMVMAVDLKGPFLCAQAAARDMVQQSAHSTIIDTMGV